MTTRSGPNNYCTYFGPESSPRSFSERELEEFGRETSRPGMDKATYIKLLVDGRKPFNDYLRHDVYVKGDLTYILHKFVIPGSLHWETNAGETMDLYRPHRNADDYQWFPRPGRGLWTSQMMVCRAPRGGIPIIADMVKGIVNGFEAFPQNIKAAFGAACDLLRENPDEVAVASEVVAASGGAPGSGAQAVGTANAICDALLPVTSPGVLPSPKPTLPAGSITTHDKKTGLFRVAVPVGAAGAVNGLGAAAITHQEIASNIASPAGARVVTTDEFERRTGTGSIWRRPSTYVAGGSLLFGAAVFGYALHRRSK